MLAPIRKPGSVFLFEPRVLFGETVAVFLEFEDHGFTAFSCTVSTLRLRGRRGASGRLTEHHGRGLLGCCPFLVEPFNMEYVNRGWRLSGAARQVRRACTPMGPSDSPHAHPVVWLLVWFFVDGIPLEEDHHAKRDGFV